MIYEIFDYLEIAFVNKDIGNRIKKIREAKNKDPKKVADEVGILPTSLSKIEREGTNSVERLVKIAHALGVNPSEFFEDKISFTKENKGEYGYATKSELADLAHTILKIAKAVERIEEQLPKKKVKKQLK